MKHDVEEANAPKFVDWIRNRGGVAWWQSHDLGNPGASVSTPALTKEGAPTPKPGWQYGKPVVITDPADIEVYKVTVVEKVPVALKRKGNHACLTAGSERKLNRIMREHGSGYKPAGSVFYRRSGDLMFPEMEVCECEAVGSLADWVKQQEKP